eukprot:235684-Hanusia_phi.AAC.1
MDAILKQAELLNLNFRRNFHVIQVPSLISLLPAPSCLLPLHSCLLPPPCSLIILLACCLYNASSHR